MIFLAEHDSAGFMSQLCSNHLNPKLTLIRYDCSSTRNPAIPQASPVPGLVESSGADVRAFMQTASFTPFVCDVFDWIKPP
jgi:hypothetical protein